MRQIIFILYILFCVVSVFSRSRIAVFPLQAKTSDSLSIWLSYSSPDLFFRTLYDCPDAQIWDPVFLSSVDKLYGSEWEDSLLKEHVQRWEWDIAVGGECAVMGDSVHVALKIVKYNNRVFESRVYESRHKISEHIVLFARLIATVLEDYDLAGEKSLHMIVRQLEVKNFQAYATYAAGYGYELRGNNEKALAAYMHAIDLDKTFAPAYFRSGVIYEHARKSVDAFWAYENAVRKSSGSLLFTAGFAGYLVSNHPSQARKIIGKNAGILSRSAEGLKAMGLSYIDDGAFQRGISFLTRAVAAGPMDHETEFALGKAYMTAGQHGMAAEVFSRLAEARPTHLRFYAFLGAAYRGAGQLMESCEVLQAALDMEPDNEYILTNLAQTYFYLEWYEQAEQLLMRAREKNPRLSELSVNLGVIYWHTGRKELASRMFKMTSDYPSTKRAALNNKANRLLLGGDTKKAIKTYRKAGKIGGVDKTVMYNMGKAFLSIGKYSQAFDCFEEVLRLDPNSINVLKLQASICQRLNKNERAEQIYKHLLDLEPRNRSAYLECIALFQSQKRYEEAVEMIEKYLSYFPNDRKFKLLLPSVWYEMGWYEVAVEEYRRLISAPEFSESYEAYLGLGKSIYDCMRFKRTCDDADRAIFYLKQAAQINPVHAEPEIIIGHLYMDFRNYRSLAIEHWRKALEKATQREMKKQIESLLSEAQR